MARTKSKAKPQKRRWNGRHEAETHFPAQIHKYNSQYAREKMCFNSNGPCHGYHDYETWFEEFTKEEWWSLCCNGCGKPSVAAEPHRLCCDETRYCISCVRDKAQEVVDALDIPVKVSAAEEYLKKAEEAQPKHTWVRAHADTLVRESDANRDWYRCLSQVWRYQENMKYKAYALVGHVIPECCGGYTAHPGPYFLDCLPRALSKKYFLRMQWMDTPPSKRRCCAFPDCGEFIPPWCKYPIFEPTDLDVAPRLYGPKAPRRAFCIACSRDSEIPEEGMAPLLAEAQKKFPWLPAGHPMLLPAGSPPAVVLDKIRWSPWDPLPWDKVSLLAPESPFEWQTTELDDIDVGVFVSNPNHDRLLVDPLTLWECTDLDRIKSTTFHW